MTRLVDKDDFVAYVDSALHTHTESVSTSIFMRSKKKKNPVSAKLHACVWQRGAGMSAQRRIFNGGDHEEIARTDVRQT